jgi:hypothetical protein
MLPRVSRASAAVATVGKTGAADAGECARAVGAEAQGIQSPGRPMKHKDFNDLTAIVIQIIDAGLPAEKANPYFVVFDADGRLWPIPPCLMSRNEIIRYVRQRFGDFAATSVAAAEALTLHWGAAILPRRKPRSANVLDFQSIPMSGGVLS